MNHFKILKKLIVSMTLLGVLTWTVDNQSSTNTVQATSGNKYGFIKKITIPKNGMADGIITMVRNQFLQCTYILTA